MANVNRQILHWTLIAAIFIAVPWNGHAKKIHNNFYHFKISVPESMREIHDTSACIRNELYCGVDNGVTLMICANDDRFRYVKDYLDCSRQELESQLREFYGDSTLSVISCGRSAYYQSETTLLSFRITTMVPDYEVNIIYFIHHRYKDIQVYFSYRNKIEAQSRIYIDAIMQTLVLY